MEEGLKVILSADVSAFEQAFVRATQSTRQAVQQINQNLKGASAGFDTLATTTNKLIPSFGRFSSIFKGAFLREFAGDTEKASAALGQAYSRIQQGTQTFGQLLTATQFTTKEMQGLAGQISAIPVDYLDTGLAKAEKTLQKFSQGKRPMADLKVSIEQLQASLPGMANTAPVEKLILSLQALRDTGKGMTVVGMDVTPKIHAEDTLKEVQKIKGLVASQQFNFQLTADAAPLTASMQKASGLALIESLKIQQAVEGITFKAVSPAPLIQGLEATEAKAREFQHYMVLSADTTRTAINDINTTLAQAGGGYGQFAQKAQKAVADYVRALGLMQTVPTAVKTTVQAPDMTPVLNAVRLVKSEVERASVAALPKLTLSADTTPFTNALLETKAVSQETWAAIRQTFTGVDTAIAAAAEKAKVSVQQLVQSFNALKGAGPNAVVMQVQPPNYAPVIAAAKVAKRNIDQVFVSPLPPIKAPQFTTGGLPELKRNLHDTTGVGLQFNQLLREMPNFAIDARIGVMSLSNNLPYFVDAIQNARKQGQGFTGILKTIGSSVFSVGGIAILAVTAFTAFAGSMRKSKEETKDAKQNMDEYVESLDVLNRARLKGEQSGAKELVNLRLLYDATQNHALSLGERKKAVDALQDQYPNYFKNISDEIILAGKAKGAYDELTQAILRKAKAESAQEELKELASQERVLRSQRKQTAQEAFDAAARITREAAAANANQAGAAQSQYAALQNSKGTAKAQTQYNDAVTKSTQLTGALNKNLSDQERLVKEIASYGTKALIEDPTKGLKTPKGEKPRFEFLEEWLDFNPNAANITQEQRQKLLEVINRYSDQFGQILEGANFRSVGTSEDQQIEAAREWWQKFQEGFIKLAPRQINVDFSQVPIVPDVPAVPDVKMPINITFTPDQIQQNAVQDAINAVVNKWRETFKGDNLKFPTIDTSKIIDPKALDSVYSRLNDFSKSVREILSTAAVDAVSGFAEGVGSALAGGNLGEALGNVLETLGSAIVQMGKKLIETSSIMEAFKKALNGLMGPGGTQFGFAIGAAMIAIGSAMKSVKMPKFADGGIVFGPTFGLMGEYAGASSNPEVIAPLSKLKDLIGGVGGDKFPAYLPMHSIKGSELKLWYARAERQGNRYT